MKEQSMEKTKRESSIYDVKSPIQLGEVLKNEPEPKFYWRGIEDVSFGYFFGPSKSGKTIFSENLAMSLATGRNQFFGSELIAEPKKVLIANFEENYRNRTRRMNNQMKSLTEEECKLFNGNVLLSAQDFPRFLYSKEDWKGFENLVNLKKPNVVIVDSLTRIVNADITSRDACKDVLARLRNLAYDNSICLIVIHHANKLSGGPLTMESMAGSSVMSQEADFSIGFNWNQVTNERYLKEVFYRYVEPKDMVLTYEISNDTNWLIPKESKFEHKVISNLGEESASYYDMVIDYLESKAVENNKVTEELEYFEIRSSELKREFVSNNTIPSRSFDYTLRNVVKNGVLTPKGPKGNYVYDLSKEQLTQVAQQNE
ncbi:AAA family ATPase [Aestuariivivens insulae]|uniref:AAA family ATPase n=1 Tax=Aestuariivivens insulae TaxID=1621988 RepID=UPI001F5642DB|nr:AAA family ATPase [Aestuariivivens insulae]